jgi:ribosomal protein S18 acetylase RimI-like enzyme
VTVLAPMSSTVFPEFLRGAIESYARQNVASGRWLAESAMELSRAEHARLLPDGLATKDTHLFEIRDPATETIVGSLWLGVQNTTGTPIGYVFNVEVSEENRRKGYARRALEALEPIGRELGLSAIGLHVFAFNAAAHGLYESLGYKVTAFNMRKNLGHEGGV